MSASGPACADSPQRRRAERSYTDRVIPPSRRDRSALRPPPEPVQVDAGRIVAVGTVLWFVLFLAMLPFWSRLRDDDHLLWLWTPLAATGLGIIGLILIRKHRGEGRLK